MAKAQNCSRVQRPAKKPKKPKPEADVDNIYYGRTIGRFLSPLTDIAEIIEYGTTGDAAMSDDEDENEPDARLAEAYSILWKQFPGFHEFLLKLTNKPVLRRAVEKQITAGMENARADDTSTLKSRIHLYLTKDPTVPLDPPLPSLKDKLHRGRAHPVFAKLLPPIQWEANDNTYTDLAQGVKIVNGKELPRFIFPLNQVFPVGADIHDPVWLDILENACKGEICLRPRPSTWFRTQRSRVTATTRASSRHVAMCGDLRLRPATCIYPVICTASTRRLNASQQTSINPRNALGTAMQYRACKLFNAVSTLVYMCMNCVYIG
ncbi:hypothetical protein K438DRAFT_1780543 [Mycena galopus ATCC 62051]|nr:hypothetical protein K438DRAFT_1780543 [Mycena galopus ATCC 62051]